MERVKGIEPSCLLLIQIILYFEELSRKTLAKNVNSPPQNSISKTPSHRMQFITTIKIFDPLL